MTRWICPVRTVPSARPMALAYEFGGPWSRPNSAAWSTTVQGAMLSGAGAGQDACQRRLSGVRGQAAGGHPYLGVAHGGVIVVPCVPADADPRRGAGPAARGVCVHHG
jgi:hypothetical protein